MIHSPRARRATILAQLVAERFRGTEPGHCARVDYLDRGEALAVCRALRELTAGDVYGVEAYVLRGADPSEAPADLLLPADQAIALRNRKSARLCLFVPADIVDAAASSLGNAFAPIDGRDLQENALKRLEGALPPSQQELIARCTRVLRGALAPSVTARLDFVEALLAYDDACTVGAELWRLGLVPDLGEAFVERLESNARCVRLLSRPARLQAPLRDRVRQLGVDGATAAELLRLLEGQPLHDARHWAKLLGEAGYTFDRWRFPETDRSNLRAVEVKPFLDAKGVVTKTCRLEQPDGPGTALIGKVGPKGKVVVEWTTDPPQPSNLARWRVEIVPVAEDADELAHDLPGREVAGNKRRTTLALDLDLDAEDLPDTALCIRVIPLDAAGNPVTDEKGTAIEATSEEFYLQVGEALPRESAVRMQAVPTLAYGRLQTALATAGPLEENAPQWTAKELDYFSVRLAAGKQVRVGLPSLLRRLEEQALRTPRHGARWVLDVERLAPAAPQAPVEVPGPPYDSLEWSALWRARDNVFRTLREQSGRGCVAAADWTPELADSTVRYARAYRQLLEALAAREPAPRAELLDALSLDTLRVCLPGIEHATETALVVLPTHPLRLAWYAAYARLLRRWEDELDELERAARRTAVDLGALAAVTPINVPPFAWWPGETSPYLFFQNLYFFYGVALPPDARDPHRRFADVASVLGAADNARAGDLRADQLSDRLLAYSELHPHARRLQLTLINPDRGEVVAETLTCFLERSRIAGRDDNVPAEVLPSFGLQAYTPAGNIGVLRGLERVRQVYAEQHDAGEGDFLQPLIEASTRPWAVLKESPPEPAHVAIVSDLVVPTDTTEAPVASADLAGAGTYGSFALYGLVARWVGQCQVAGGEVRWCYRLVVDPPMRPDSHPVGPRYSDALMDLYASLLEAGGRVQGGERGRRLALVVALPAEDRRLLAELHAGSDWVIVADRFFGPDYYDSPQIPLLADAAREYLLDYTPSFAEGLGHRLIVTTAVQDDVLARLQAALRLLGLPPSQEVAVRLLDQLKMLSGRFALRALLNEATAVRSVCLASTLAWLHRQGRLAHAVLVPIHGHPELFGEAPDQSGAHDDVFADCLLVTLKRNIVETTVIAVSRRYADMPIEEQAEALLLRMERTARLLETRFFDDERRVDGALQRARLAAVLRFYLQRAVRHGLINPETEATFAEHLTRLDRAGLEFRRPQYEGYLCVVGGAPPRPRFTHGDARITLLSVAELVVPGGEPIAIGPDTAGAPLPLLSTANASPPDSAATEPVPVAGLPGEAPVSFHASGAADEEQISHTVAGSPSAPEGSAALATSPPAAVEVLLGYHAASGEPIVWRPGVQGAPHMFVLGIPGQGKSWTVARVVRELATQGVPSLILDFHGQFAAADGLLRGGCARAVLDARTGLPFSPFELSAASGVVDWQSNALAVAEIFAYVCKLGDMQRDVVYQAVRDAYRQCGFDESTSPTAILEYPSLRDVLRRLERLEATGQARNVVARCRPLLEFTLFRPKEGVDFARLVRGGLVIDLHRLADVEMVQLAAGAFVLRKLYKDMFGWGEADRLRLMVVLDEAHRLAQDRTLPKLMKEGRKFGIGVLVASQSLADFHEDVRNNVGTRVVFRTNYPESRRVAGFITTTSPEQLVSRIENLEVGQAYVQTAEMRLGALVRMAPPDEQPGASDRAVAPAS